MGIILFFGMSLCILIVGFTYTFFVFRHHWRVSKQKSLAAELGPEKT